MPALLPLASPTPRVTTPKMLARRPSSKALWPMTAFMPGSRRTSRLVGGSRDPIGVFHGVGLGVLDDDAVARERVSVEVAFEHDRRRVRPVVEQRRLVPVVNDQHLHALAGDAEGDSVARCVAEAAGHHRSLYPEPVGTE